MTLLTRSQENQLAESLVALINTAVTQSASTTGKILQIATHSFTSQRECSREHNLRNNSAISPDSAIMAFYTCRSAVTAMLLR